MHLSLTLQGAVNGAAASDVTEPQHALNLPNIGDTAVVTAYEGNVQVAFSLSPSAACANVVTISPESDSMQQTVKAIASGQCNADVKAGDGTTATLAIFSLPPP